MTAQIKNEAVAFVVSNSHRSLAEFSSRSGFERVDDLDKLVSDLHAQGMTITQSIKTVRERLGIGLGAAKFIVATHPIWSDIVAASQPLYDALASALAAESR